MYLSNNLIFKCCAIALAFTLVSFDDDFLTKIVAKFDTFQQKSPQEKVYLHLDRPYYSAGETLWFKAYLVYGSSHKIDSISKVLYIDLISKSTGKVLLLKKIKMEAGIGHGNMALADSLPTGEYQLRAYTNYMRNYDEAFFYRHDFTIFKTDAATTAFPANVDDIDLQFMPEGGHLVNGLESRVAFKAVNVLGKGVAISGAIMNQKNDTIAGFSTKNLGMGYFNLNPEAGQQYHVEVLRGDGKYQKYALPTALKEGFVMLVDNLSNKDNLRIIVQHNKATNTAEIGLFGHARGEIIYAAKTPLTKKMLLFTIPRNKLPEGITHFTLFDEQSRPVAERLVFVDHHQTVNVELIPKQKTVKTREKIEIDIIAKNQDGTPVSANFSLAATDASQVIEKELFATNIRSYLLINSDLKGTIEQPSSYFDKQNIDSKSNADLLMMTQGWRRFSWPQVMVDSLQSLQYMLEQGVSFSGKVLRPNKKTAGKIKLTFMLQEPDSSRSFLMGETNELGQFAAYDLDLRDSTSLLIQAITEKGNRNLNITLDPYLPATTTITRVPYNSIQFDANELAEYLRRAKDYLDIERKIRESREKMLQEVVIKAKKSDEAKKDTRRMMYGEADNTIKFDATNSSGAANVFDVLQGRVAGLSITGSGLDRTVQIRGAANFSGVVEPLFILDGMTVDKSTIMTISPFDVEAVDVIKGAKAAMYGSQGSGGVIAVLTKRGNDNYDASKDVAEGVLVTKIMGYSNPREFYAPRYDKPIAEHVRPDFRATLHWSPMIQTDREGKAKVSFFASDAKTNIRLRIEGITQEGMTGIANAEVRVVE